MEKSTAHPALQGALQPLSARPWIIWFFLSAIFLGLSFTSLTQKSATFDEPSHFAAGHTQLRWGDYRLDPNHPSLPWMMAALPSLMQEVRITPAFQDDWQLALPPPDAAEKVRLRLSVMSFGAGQELLYGGGNDADGLLFGARRMMVLLSLGLGALLFAWGRAMGGLATGAAATALWALDPNFIAHGQLITNDVPATAAICAALFACWHVCRRLTLRNLLWLGAATGAALLTKYSAILLLPMLGLLLAARVWRSDPWTTSWPRELALSSRCARGAGAVAVLAFALAASWAMIWACYRFRWAAGEGGQLPTAFLVGDRALSLAGKFFLFCHQHQLLPEAYAHGLLVSAGFAPQAGELDGGAGWVGWLTTLVWKVPLPTMIALGLAAWLFLRGKLARDWDLFFLLAPIAVYLPMAFFSELSAQLRYLLPIFPFLLLLAARGLVLLRGRWRVGALALWLAWNALWSWPHYLSFCNEPARAVAAARNREAGSSLFEESLGRSHSGRRLLLDSNLDWGQDLPALARWMEENRVEEINLCYFGRANPSYHGIRYVNLPRGHPRNIRAGDTGAFAFGPPPQPPRLPGFVAISATYLEGYGLNEEARAYYAPLRSLKPVANLGNSLLVFRLDSLEGR